MAKKKRNRKPGGSSPVKRPANGYAPVQPSPVRSEPDDAAFAQHRTDMEQAAAKAAEVAPSAAERVAAARERAEAAQAEIRAGAVELHEGGWSLRQIAEVAGVGRDTVSRWIAASEAAAVPRHEL